jgi:heptaprenyl diphosphate synthase
MLQAATFERLVMGQMQESLGPKPGDEPIAHYLNVLSDKTGSLIAFAAEMGIRMADGPELLIPAVRAFGEKIGIAFQLVDDVIDLADRSAGTGKPPGTDVRHGVTTLPMLFLREDAANNDASGSLLATLGRGAAGDLSEEEFQGAIAALRSHEATERTMDKAREMADEAIAHLDVAPEGIVRDALVRFAHQVVDRSY